MTMGMEKKHVTQITACTSIKVNHSVLVVYLITHLLLTSEVLSNISMYLTEEVEISEVSVFADIYELSMIPINHINTISFSLSQVA